LDRRAGLRIVGLKADSPLAEARLPVGGLLRRIGGHRVTNQMSRAGWDEAMVRKAVRSSEPGDRIEIEVVDASVVPLSIRLGRRPIEMMPIDPGGRSQLIERAQKRFLTWWDAHGGEPLPTRRPQMRRITQMPILVNVQSVEFVGPGPNGESVPLPEVGISP
jgi:hypothetical protein